MLKPILLLIALFVLAFPVAAAEPAATEKDVRSAITKALPLLQKGAAGHRAERTCFACHNQGIPILALTTARSRGFTIDEDDLQKHLRFINDFLGKNRANFLKGRGTGGQVDTAGYALWTLEMGGWKANETTAAVAEYLLLYQKERGHWRLTSNRPPSEVSLFTTNYLGVRGLQTYGTPEQQDRIAERLPAIRRWLSKTAVKETEDQVFRLWALKRVGAESKEILAATLDLLKLQDENGGWAQRDTMKPDAYATGTALTVLHQAADVPPNDPAYQRGVQYLLKSQLDDGSWYVRSRSRPFQIYFESGFPHGTDQFISIAASGWATTALALTLPREEH